MSQTVQEVNYVFQAWSKSHAPKDLILDSQKNIDLMVDYVRLYHGGIASITSLNDAVANIPNLEYRNRKTPAQRAEEFEAKELARRLKDQIENSIDWKENAKKVIDAQDRKREADDKQAVAKEAINTAIESYECYRGPNMRDYTKMDQRKDYLRKLVASQPTNVDQVKLLQIIRDKIMRFPD